MMVVASLQAMQYIEMMAKEVPLLGLKSIMLWILMSAISPHFSI